MTHLDTNYLILAMQPGTAQDHELRGWIATGHELGISAVAWAEFLCGPLDGGQRHFAELLLPVREPFIASDAERASDLFNQTGRHRRSLIDCMIAAVAIRVGAELATENRDDFRRFEPFGLRLVTRS